MWKRNRSSWMVRQVGEVIEFKDYATPPHFAISVIWQDNKWNVDVIDFHRPDMPTHEMFREIAETLIPVAGGLIHNAEALMPTDKGCMITNITIYDSGIIDFQTQPLNTAKRRAWFMHALDTIRADVETKWKRKRKP
jgi:hypothetical protein